MKFCINNKNEIIVLNIFLFLTQKYTQRKEQGF